MDDQVGTTTSTGVHQSSPSPVPAYEDTTTRPRRRGTGRTEGSSSNGDGTSISREAMSSPDPDEKKDRPSSRQETAAIGAPGSGPIVTDSPSRGLRARWGQNVSDSPSATAAAVNGPPPRQNSSVPSRRTASGASGGSVNGGPGTLTRMRTALLETKTVRREPTYKESLIAIVKCSWLNLLLVFVPVSWALHWGFGTNPSTTEDTIIFVTAFLAIIPLAKLLGFGTEELAMRVGQTLGGLLNATLGNAVELIISILALIKCELQIVQSSLLGSILSNLLLVLGMCFFAGGIRFSEQGFKETASQLNSSLLAIAVIAVLIPAGFHAAFSQLPDNTERPDILKMSRGTAVILLVIYGAYLLFQLWTHAHLYDEHPGEDANPTRAGRAYGGHRFLRAARSVNRSTNSSGGNGDPSPSATAPSSKITNESSAVEQGNGNADVANDGYDDDEVEEEEIPTVNWYSALILLTVVTVLVGVTSEWLVSSINGVTSTGAISDQWVGLILLPIVGNAAEHVTAVSVSVHDKLDLSISVAVGSSIQIALFVIPLLVVLGWIMDKPLSLLFDPFESIVLFLSVMIVNFATADGKSNWMEGFLLMMVYLLIAVAMWFYPSDQADTAVFLQCGTIGANQ